MLIVKGAIIQRTRRSFTTKDNREFTKITYVIANSSLDRTIFVSEVDPEEPFEKGEEMEIPVEVKTYVTKAGVARFELVTSRSYASPSKYLANPTQQSTPVPPHLTDVLTHPSPSTPFDSLSFPTT